MERIDKEKNKEKDKIINTEKYEVKINENIKELIKKFKNEINEENQKLMEKLEQFKNLLNNQTQKYNKYTEIMEKSLLEKDKEINDLNLKLSKYPFELFEGEKLLSITFMSYDENIRKNIICKNTDKIVNLEKQLYKDYPQYFNSKYYFTKNGKKINKDINLDENNINNNDIIILENENKLMYNNETSLKNYQLIYNNFEKSMIFYSIKLYFNYKNIKEKMKRKKIEPENEKYYLINKNFINEIMIDNDYKIIRKKIEENDIKKNDEKNKNKILSKVFLINI